MDSTVELFKSGVQNILNDEIIPNDAAQDSLGYLTRDGKIRLINGRALIGADSGTTGTIRGLHHGYKVDGTEVLYRKTETKLQYLDGDTWTDILTDLTSGSEGSFANYSSLAGAFTFFVNVDGYWKINNANPTSAISMYDATQCPYFGSILIDRGRTLLWDKKLKGQTVSSDPTGLYGSHIDPQGNGYYTSVSGESAGSSGQKAYSGSLAFKASGATRNCFGVTIQATVAAGTETFTDDYLGTLTSNYGGTGTINYATGDYSVTFSDTTTGSVTADYLWEDSNQKGVTDFTHSATRIAAEGFVERQDVGGDAIMNVLVGQDGDYYSLKKQSAYQLNIGADDTTFTNQIYYSNMGLPSRNAAIATDKGIIFLNTSNSTKPEMTILQKNLVTSNLLPVILFAGFKFADYDFSDCYFNTYERYVTVSCRKLGSDHNDTILLCNIEAGTVDISPYEARMFSKDADENLYVGSPLQENVYQIYSGFDDLGNPILNYWISCGDAYGSLKVRQMRWRFIREELKKFRKFKIKGYIALDQVVQVWMSYDDAPFQQVGTILGRGTYVDSGAGTEIGTTMIGEQEVGGTQLVTVYPYFCQLAVRPPKFRKRAVKFVATGIGYFDIQFMSDYDLMLFENRLPVRFRSKQKVSLDGTETNLTDAQAET